MNDARKKIDSTYKHFSRFTFSQDINCSSMLRCAECGLWSQVWRWKHTEIFCEICGDHEALMCPECMEHFDCVWDDEEIEVKNE